MTCTGWGVLDMSTRTLPGRLVQAGYIRPDGKTPGMEKGHGNVAISLFEELDALLTEFQPDYIAAETPAVQGRTRKQWGFDKQSKMTAPVYGVAVGAAVACAWAWRKRVKPACQLISFPADAWNRGLPSTKDDEHKTRRVAFVASQWGRRVEDFGPVTYAGNAADALLIANHLAARVL